MNAEELLNSLREQGLDDESIKALLSDAMASLEGPAEEPMDAPVEEDGEAKVRKLLGVE